MRLFLEMIKGFSDTEIKEIIKENINLINFEEYDLKSLNKFVDDLIEIIKKEQKIKLTKSKENKSFKSDKNFEEFSGEFRRRTINLRNSAYRPASVLTQKRKTVEIFLDKINKSPKQKYEMKFNNYEKNGKNIVRNSYKDFKFYEGDPYDKGNNRSFANDDYIGMRNNLMDLVYFKTEENEE